ncbi:MAG TPA: hypothetical protein VF017_03845 [Thermoanaerobaculia bacterium]|nr:hypothetical protein [Thermoanaerobaculia bacterium]
MSRSFRQITVYALSLVALAGLAATAVDAQLPSYSVTRTRGTTPQACSDAVQVIENQCASHGPITVNPRQCDPLFDFWGNLLGYACVCRATTTFCISSVPLP